MLERGHGRVMNVASTASFQPGPLMAVYYATKSYVLSFTEAIAEETRGTGVTVTALCPGPDRIRLPVRGRHGAVTARREPQAPERGRRGALRREGDGVAATSSRCPAHEQDHGRVGALHPPPGPAPPRPQDAGDEADQESTVRRARRRDVRCERSRWRVRRAVEAHVAQEQHLAHHEHHRHRHDRSQRDARRRDRSARCGGRRRCRSWSRA